MKVRHACDRSNSNTKSAVEDIGEVAIIGGGLAGLLAALAVEPFSKSVRIFERRLDVVQGDTSARSTQKYGYAIVSGGLDSIQELSPSLFEALTSGGACLVDASAQVRFYEGAVISPTLTSNLRILTASRTHIAEAIHKQVQLYPRIRVEHAVVERVFPAGIKAVVETNAEKMSFDLVIDASGRRPMSDNHRPFSHNFYSAGITTPVSYEPDVTIRSIVVDSWTDHDQDWALLVGNMPPPEGRAGSQIMRIENGQVQVAVAERFSRGSSTTTASEIIQASLPAAIASKVTNYLDGRMLRQQRYRFAYRTQIERTKRHPVSFLVLGDALMSTNPIYGLGIASAAIEAQALRNAVKECLRINDTTLIVSKYYSSIRRTTNLAWKVSSWTDKCYRLGNDRLSGIVKLLTPVRSAAMKDPTACSQLYRAVALSTSASFERTILHMVFAAFKNWIWRFARSILPTPRGNRDINTPRTAPQIKDDEPRL
ncbi:hypothetical protein [Jiella pacifica]|uniref:2-polyprenyl-6-methoxyphenol hydroxylase n=1 Tax=Jiella pacifica TaxID=2696469 RepID=A0A6N9T850_9HYPH|nr:hypothetical protein [Jiella pacifica]NDW07460.1 hypothetical protein [Jiella pacifica]